MAAAAAEAKGRGDALFRAGRHADAAAAYGEALAAAEAAADPALLHLIYANRAAARLELRDWRGALGDALQAAAVDDTYVKAHYRAAVALQQLGRVADALRSARRAAQLDPSNRQAAALAVRLAAAGADGGAGTAAAPREGAPGAAAAQGAAPSAPAEAKPPAAAAGAAAPPPWAAWAEAPLSEQGVLSALPAALQPGACFQPSPDGREANVLVMFHGLGDRPAPFAALARHMALPQTAALALAGPIPVPETDGGRAWLQSFDSDFEPILPRPVEQRRARSLGQTVDSLLPLLAALGGERGGGWGGEQGGPGRGCGGRRRRVHLFGFSQGGTVALELARRLCGGGKSSGGGGGGGGSKEGGGDEGGGGGPPAWLGSVVAISAALLEESLPGLEAAQGGGGAGGAGGGARALLVLLTHGDRDVVLPRSAVERSAALLRAQGCAAALHAVPGKGHAMLGPDRGEAGAVMRFYAKALAAAPPGGEEEGEFVEIDPGAAALA